MANLLNNIHGMSWVYISLVLLAVVIMNANDKGWLKALFVVVIAVVAVSIYAEEENKKAYNERQAAYAAEMAWKKPIINNCESAVRAMSDAQTASIVGDRWSPHVNETDRGYLYEVEASDATTANKIVTMLCYTDRNGQVVRVVPKNRY